MAKMFALQCPAMPHVYVDLLFRPWSCKGGSDLKACLDPPRSCENLNIGFSVQTEPFY